MQPHFENAMYVCTATIKGVLQQFTCHLYFSIPDALISGRVKTITFFCTDVSKNVAESP